MRIPSLYGGDSNMNYYLLLEEANNIFSDRFIIMKMEMCNLFLAKK